MTFPSTSIFVPLPEELGIIENVKAVITIYNDTINIPCKHITRYHSLDGSEWPEIFDSDLNVIKDFVISENDEPNTSVFEGNYIIYDKLYLEGDMYFVFDFCKDGFWYKNYRTNSIKFELDEDDYEDLLEMLN